MAEIWVISDTHFQHENILKYETCRAKEWENVDQMNEGLMDYWNETVKPGDKVYHLGDVFFNNKETFCKFWPKLNGKKRLIVGNHDDIKFLSSGSFFKKVYMWRILGNKVLTHVPIHPSSLEKKGWFNIHGHTHSKGSPKGPYASACVEMTNFRPKNIEDY